MKLDDLENLQKLIDSKETPIEFIDGIIKKIEPEDHHDPLSDPYGNTLIRKHV